jgi:chemotaxis protein CheD
MTKTKAIYVPVGELRVADNDTTELWTVTASCVALILTDTVHHVIGMIHIVLPGRRSELRKDDRHAYFADTGAPLLINEMLKAGSDRNCLSAILVGGGSLFQWQEGVDIGRENVAALKACLQTQNIPIIREETGGADGRRVSLRSGFQNLLIEPIKYRQSDEKGGSGTISPKDLMPYIDELEKIPADKSLTENLLSEIHAQTVDREKVCTILSGEPLLTLYFFRLINSPYYGISGNIASFSRVKQLISAPHFRRICVVTSFAGNKDAEPSLPDDIIREWKNHSLATAFIARHISETIVPDLKEEAYISGLLHSLGDLCLALENPLRINSGRAYSAESTFKTGSTLTADLMQFWNYPETLSNAVSSDLSLVLNKSEGKELLPAVIHVACWISRLIGITTKVEHENFILNTQVAKALGISESIHTILPPILSGLENLGLKEWIKK